MIGSPYGEDVPPWLPDLLFQPEPIVWVQHLFGLGHPPPFRLVDLLASTWGVLFAIALALWLWGREDAYALAAIVAMEALLNLALNQYLSVPRPSAPEIVKYEQVGLGSFPSGHAFTATVLWGLLWARGRVPLWLAALLILATAVGRLYLGVHYLADVAAGVALGAVLVWAFRALWPRVRDRLARWPYAALLGAAVLASTAVAGPLVLMDLGNRFAYNAAALGAGGALALLVEYRFVRYSPVRPDAGSALGRLGIGLLGIAPLAAVDRWTGEDSLWLGAALMLVGALWALLLAPALFRRMGWSSPASPPLVAVRP